MFSKLHEDMDRLTRSLTPSYVDFYQQIERALGPIRQQHMAFADLASSQVSEIVQANQHWQDMIDQATVSSLMLGNLSHTHETWVKGLKSMQDQLAQLQAATKLTLAEIAHRLTISESMIVGIDFEAIRRSMVLPELAISGLRDAISDMTEDYRNLADSIQTYTDITHLPTFVLPSATREIFATGYAVDALQVPNEADSEEDLSQLQVATEVAEETSICVSLLQGVDPTLARPYMGARDALHNGNPDRARHILTSLRELWNHLLRQLAPNEHVLAWIPKDDKELLHEGRPTRRARVLHICRDLNHSPLSDFVVHDTRALVKLIEFFNRVHELESELTDAQLRALLLRTDSWLTYILNIWKESK